MGDFIVRYILIQPSGLPQMLGQDLFALIVCSEVLVKIGSGPTRLSIRGHQAGR